MNNVLITPIKGSTALVNKFPGSEDKGYLLLKETTIEFGRGWASPKVRTALLKGEFPVLEAIIQGSNKLKLNGRIVVREYPADNVPDDMAREFFNKNAATLEEAMQPYLKTTGGDNIPLTTQGTEIVRFAYYDSTGQETDVLCAHDNGGEISAVRKEQASIGASFTGAGEKE